MKTFAVSGLAVFLFIVWNFVCRLLMFVDKSCDYKKMWFISSVAYAVSSALGIAAKLGWI